jgi:peptidyl-prolyl cis-trans isomerase SurA
MTVRSFIRALALIFVAFPIWAQDPGTAAPLTGEPGGQSEPVGETKREVLDFIVAVVDDDIITAAELREAARGAVRQLQAQGTSLPPQDVLLNRVLERLVLQRLEIAAADRAGIQVDDQTINAALADIARRNNVTLGALRQTLEGEGYNYERFREDIRRDITSARLRQRMVDSQITVTEQEVDSFLAQQGERDLREYRLQQILIGLPEGASPEVIDTARGRAEMVLQRIRQGADFQEMAVSFSDGQQALEGGDLGWRQANEIPGVFTSAVQAMQAGDVSEPIRTASGFHILKVAEIRGRDRKLVEQLHARHILIGTNELVTAEQAQLQLQRLRERILGGTDFAELAQANSDDTGSARQGGDLGWKNTTDFVPEFADQVLALDIGEVSEPFQSRFGWHIVELLERRSQDNTEEFLRNQAREAILRRKADEEWELYTRRLRDEAYVEERPLT